MKPKILIIDDDEALLKIARVGLEGEGFEVTTAKSGPEGLKAAYGNHPDLVILDIMMPGMDGLEVSRRLRELSDTPIILLTALSNTPDIVKGLGAGADDYITKPFAMAELVARVKASLRRKSGTGSGRPAVLVRGSLTIDLVRRKVMLDGKPVNLTPTEYRLLAYLARSPGQVIPHRTLLVEVWGPEYADQTDYLHLYVRYLRQKIEQDASRPEIIKTERGIGYYFQED
jgi:two-component system KDP operon response regulator KdpE